MSDGARVVLAVALMAAAIVLVFVGAWWAERRGADIARRRRER